MEWRLFATLSEAAGTSAVEVDPEQPATVGDALDALLAAHPELESEVRPDGDGVADHLRLLVDGRDAVAELEGLETPVEDDDELALMPPVSGG